MEDQILQTTKRGRKHFFIHGQVQGVGYRYSLQKQALSLGLKGWCRNLQNGCVEAEVYGPIDAIETLTQWCYQGPPAAQVSHIEIENLPLSEESSYLSFQIIR